MKTINETLWFTYRKNAKMGMQAYSDIGWGCVLRVAQMAFANTLLKHSKNKSEIDRLSIINACT
jgi:cysteine protease ATG4